MKVLLVTSQITYVPNNCQDFLDKILENNATDIAGLVILQNFSLNLVPKILWLYRISCINFANTLSHNMFELLFDKREKLFKKNDIPVFKLKNINDSQVVNWVKENNIDLIVNLRTRCIYKSEILHVPRFGCVNFHHGILPKYRGVFCDLYALYENRPAGITIHQMNEKIDNGEIIFTKQISHKKELDYMNYLSRTGKEEAQLLIQLINYMKKNDKMPSGIRNYSKQPVFTKTPTVHEIDKMRKGGIIL